MCKVQVFVWVKSTLYFGNLLLFQVIEYCIYWIIVNGKKIVFYLDFYNYN